jgi:hypothetical protein
MTERSTAVKNAWAEGVTYFAISLLIVVGILQILQGLAAVTSDQLYAAAPGQALVMSLNTWGWVHLVMGIIAVAVAVGLFYGKTWARWAGMTIAGLQALAQFLFMPFYASWSIVILALDVAIIWALATYRSDKFM